MAFTPGTSGNPAGRPKGARGRSGLELLEPHARPILRKLIERALDGEIEAMRVLADRLWPKLKPSSQKVTLFSRGASLANRGEAVIDAVLTGQLGPDEAKDLMSALQGLGRIIEVSELVSRVEALESSTASLPMPRPKTSHRVYNDHE